MTYKTKILIFYQPNQFCIPAVRSLETSEFQLGMGIRLGRGVTYSHKDYMFNYPKIRKHFFNQKIKNVSDLYDIDAMFIFYDKIISECKYQYIFPLSSELGNHVLARLNEKYNLMGIKKEHIELLDKNNYYDIMENIGIPIPKRYDLDVKFPLIVKPSKGSSGIGTKIIYDFKELNNWFSVGDHHPESPSYEGVCFQEQVNGKRRHPEYVSYNGEYIIQEYIEADLITIFGRIVNNEIYYDTIFDVKITEPPYCAEIEYSFPSKVCSKLVEEIYKNCSKFLDHIKLNNSPFLFDILVTKDQFFIIDFGMRVSTTPQPAIHAMCPNYSKEWVTSLLQQKRYKPKFTKSCVYKRPLFRPGIIESLEFQNYELLESYELPSKGTEILEPRNDNSLFPNGYMIAVADTKKEALDKIKKVENTFFIKYKDEVKTIKLST